MDIDQPVFGLQPKGLNGKDEADSTIQEMAAYYIADIIKHNPRGPYCLAGYSFGGIVAFEMAKQLEKAGREVKLLAMFDTTVGNLEYTGTGIQKIWKKTRLQFPKMLFIIKSFGKYPGDILAYQWYVIKRKTRSFLQKIGLLAEDASEKMLPHEKRIIEKHMAAYENYIVTLYGGRIDLFRVKKRVYFLDDPVYLGWKPFAAKGVIIHEVPGDHRTFLLPPNDKVFANMFQSVINERLS